MIPQGWILLNFSFLEVNFKSKDFANFEKQVIISCSSGWLCATKAVLSANTSLRIRRFLTFLADLNWLAWKRFSLVQLRVNTVWVQSVKFTERKTGNREKINQPRDVLKMHWSDQHGNHRPGVSTIETTQYKLTLCKEDKNKSTFPYEIESISPD